MSIAEQPAPYYPQASVDDALARLAWRRALSDVDCRSMAYEYRVHEKAVKRGEEEMDECLVDAWAEYQHRFGDRGRPQTEYLKKPKMPKSRRARSQAGQVSPLYNERGELI